eukprot:Protomagalhaensia_wolfi_Nauph_80__3342@NODE_33_length_4594_cov_158_586169_g26_i0_p1_GENE_NODE_33_length_4594_cov_158_586169_g26_i0NODE_33_length_4594_cov_158_586169_g26_i0_p1_ORF_typecomplete_len493_score55_04Redoxin/PF08534_10/1_6e10_NODE_33_length_4594_cov_158_586169_g26_i016403118
MLSPGDPFPSTCIGLKSQDFDLRERFQETAGLLIGSIGAFHPVDTHTLLPGYKDLTKVLNDAGVGFIACVAVNDPYVLRAWARRMKILSEITFISDVDATLSRALGMAQTMQHEGFGAAVPRCRRFAMLVAKGATVLDVALDDEALAERFVSRALPLLSSDNVLPNRQQSDLSSKSSEIITGATSATRATSSHPPPQVKAPLETWYPARWLVPYPLVFGPDCVLDVDVESIAFDYSQSSLCDAYTLTRVGGALELSPDADDELGSATVDYMRQVRAMRRLVRQNTGLDSKQAEAVYSIRRIIVTSEWGLMIENPVLNDGQPPDPHHYGTHTTAGAVIVIHDLTSAPPPSEECNEPSQHLVVVFGLVPGGRDSLLSNLFPLLPLEHGQQRRIKRLTLPTDLKDQGLGISHLVAARDKFYSFKTQCPLITNELGQAQEAQWFVAAEKAYASEAQLDILKSLRITSSTSAELAVLPPMAQDEGPEPIFYTVCDCH